MSQKVDREAVLPDPYIRLGTGPEDHRAHDLAAGGIAQGVDDPRMRMAPFAGQGHLAVDLVEVGAPGDQLVDPRGGLADHQRHDLGVTQPPARRQGVGDVVLEVVLGIEHTGDPPLGIRTIALADLFLGDNQNA